MYEKSYKKCWTKQGRTELNTSMKYTLATMAEERKIRETKFGEEIPKIRSFSFSVTSRCNMDCNYCFQDGRDYYTGPDMTLDEFKHLVDQVKEYGNRNGKQYPICIAGGEPFLNKGIEEMSRYAVSRLGRERVSITTNLSKFPTNATDGAVLLFRLGMPHITASIDREHLRFGTEMEARVKAFFKAAKKVGVSASAINVAQTKYQEKHRFPRGIAGAIPKDLKEKLKQNAESGRTELYSHKPARKEIRKYIKELKSGREINHHPFSLIANTGLSPYYGTGMPVEVTFAPNGKAYLFAGMDVFHFPQLSLGSWKRESLFEIVEKNLPYKMNLIKPWFGMSRIRADKRHDWKSRFTERESPAKARLFGEYASRRFEAQAKKKRNRLRR